ncbi:MAG: GNAT family N-acetyltransferase [Candidatus Tectomicrobia bacterium]
MKAKTSSILQDSLVNVDWTEDPTLSTILHLAEIMVNDPIRTTAYTDTFPDSVHGWEQMFHSGTILPFVWFVDGKLAGFQWGHDLGTKLGQRYGWVSIYILEAFRGRDWWLTVNAAYQQFIATLQAHEIASIFVACRWSNIKACRFATKVGFTSLGHYPDWASFEGMLDAVELFTWRPEDVTLAWEVATQRAEYGLAIVSEKYFTLDCKTRYIKMLQNCLMSMAHSPRCRKAVFARS